MSETSSGAPAVSRSRLSIVGIVCISLFGALLARLWYLQLIDSHDFEVAAPSVHLRTIHEQGPRGRILDRNGKVLVDNRVTKIIGLDRQPIRKLPAEERTELFRRLAQTLTEFGIPTKAPAIEKLYDDKRYGPLELVPIATDVDNPDLEVYLGEHHLEFPGVEVRRRTVRTYPYGSLAAHIVGYVGQINEAELAAKQKELGKPGRTAASRDAKTYKPGDEIGKAGVEASYEDVLRGVPSDKTIQVDARGDYLATVKESTPRPGDDIWLTIDADLQAYAEQLLRNQLDALRGTIEPSTGKVRRVPQGSVVITNPQTGEILAMASYPTYDPSQLVNGIDSELWRRLNDKAAGQPLFNWALQGTYAPGSTFKLFSALAALETGFLGPGRETYVDRGSYTVKNCKGGKCTFRNAGGARYGTVNVTRSLTVSSDVFYYWIADQLWQQRATYGDQPIQDMASRFGIGARTGVRLPGESRGRLPTPTLMRQLHEQRPDVFPRGSWYSGDNLLTAIGQGDVLVTPLQLVNAYATFANGGNHLVPQIVLKVTRPADLGYSPSDPANLTVQSFTTPQSTGKIEFPGDSYAKLAAGLNGVVQSPAGTAHRAWSASRTAWPMAGKTGTAQVTGKADTSVFVGYGPTDRPPEYAIAVILPEAGFGGDVAAPLAFRIMKAVSEGTVPVTLSAQDRAREQAPPPVEVAAAVPGGGRAGP
jgi:penicillin-binding protein 2